MAITGNRRLRQIVVITVCVVWALNLTVMPLIVNDYQSTDLNPLLMAIIAALLLERKGSDDGDNSQR